MYVAIVSKNTLRYCGHDHLWVHRLSVSFVNQILASTTARTKQSPGAHTLTGGRDAALDFQVSVSP